MHSWICRTFRLRSVLVRFLEKRWKDQRRVRVPWAPLAVRMCMRITCIKKRTVYKTMIHPVLGVVCNLSRIRVTAEKDSVMLGASVRIQFTDLTLIIMLAFITFNSSLVPLIGGLYGSNPWKFEFSGLRRNRTDDLGINSPSL